MRAVYMCEHGDLDEDVGLSGCFGDYADALRSERPDVVCIWCVMDELGEEFSIDMEPYWVADDFDREDGKMTDDDMEWDEELADQRAAEPRMIVRNAAGETAIIRRILDAEDLRQYGAEEIGEPENLTMHGIQWDASSVFAWLKGEF